MQGTPKTLEEAISNALIELSDDGDDVSKIKAHVRDFLAQRFLQSILESPGIPKTRLDFHKKSVEELSMLFKITLEQEMKDLFQRIVDDKA